MSGSSQAAATVVMPGVRRREEEERREQQKQGIRHTMLLDEARQDGDEEDQEWMMAGAAAGPPPSSSTAAAAGAASPPLPAAALTASTTSTASPVSSLPPLSSADSAGSHWPELLRGCHEELSVASLSSLSAAIAALRDEPSLWPSFAPHLPSLLSLLRLCPASAPSSQWRLLLDAVTAVAVARPTVVLLAANSSSGSQPSADAQQQLLSGHEDDDDRKREARAACLWSSMSDCLSRLTCAVLEQRALSPLPLCLLYRCCASLYPSTLSLLDRYGDQSGTVGDALAAIRRQVEAQIIRPMGNRAVAASASCLAWLPACALLLRHCAAFINVLLLTHSAINQHDGDDATLNPHRSLTALQRGASSSSSSLASLPAVSSEAGLYLAGIRAFSVAAVSDSHPDLDAAAMQQEAEGWVKAMALPVSRLSAELAAVVSSLSLDSAAFLPVSCQTVQCLLLLARQRSEMHHAVLVPALASLAQQLLQQSASSSSSPLLPASLRQALLHSLRLGLFACFRLPACLPHVPSLLSVLSVPHNSIIAMETARLHKQRQQQQQLSQGGSAAVAVANSSAPAAASASAAPAALDEVLDVSSPLAAGLLSSLSTLPVSAVCELIVRCMERLPASRHAALLAASTAAAQILHSPTGQHLFLQVLAAVQQQQQQQLSAQPAASASTTSPSLSTSSSALPSAASAALLPPLTAVALPPSTLSSLARSSFSRILATEEEAAAAQQSSLRAAVLTAIAAAGRGLRVVHTLTVKDTRGLRVLKEALVETSAGRQPQLSRLLSGGAEAAVALSSSLTSSAEYSALLSFVLSDLLSRYDLCLSLLYRLLHVRPEEHRITLAPPLQDAEAKEEEEEEQEADSADEQQDEELQTAAAAAGGAAEHSDGSAAASEAKRERQSRKRPLSSIAAAAELDDDDAAAKQQKPESETVQETEEGSVSSERAVGDAERERDSLLSSSSSCQLLLAVAEYAQRSAGSVEYGSTVDCLLSALDSSLFTAVPAAAEPAAASASSPYGRLFVQFTLDLPVLTAGLWSALSRYLLPQPGSSQHSVDVALAALRALIAFRPPAEESAVRLLLQVVKEGDEAAVRGRCLELAVEAAMRADARPALSASVVQFALELASAVCSAAFLSELPVIEVSVVIPPQPVYEQIALPPQPQSVKDEERQEEEKALPAGADGSTVDGSAAADEARRRETQSLIAEAQRRRREFEKLSMRRELLIKEKERLDRQAAERLTQRRQRTERQLAPLLALLRAAKETLEPQLPSPPPSPPPRHAQLFSCLLSVYRRSGAAEPARKLIHSALPAIVAGIGPTPSLLSALRAESSGAEACVLHCLQLLCNNPLEPSQSPLALPSSSPVLVHAASPVALLCWQLFESRGGDARFLIPVLPILRAEQARRCLHRVVLLPPAHLKVAMSRLVKPQQSLAARGNKLTLGVSALTQHQHLTPADMVVQLHRLDTTRRQQLAQDAAAEYPTDDSLWLRSLIAACQLCFSFLDVFTPPVFVAVLSSLRNDRPLSRLLLRSCIQMIQLYPSLASFILTVLQQLTHSERQLVQQSALWEGLLKVAAMTLPVSLELLISLPDAAVVRLFTGQPASASSPLALCRAAVTRLVQQQPHRVSALLRQRVLGGGADAASAERASREQQQQQPQSAPAPPAALHPLPPPQPPAGRGWAQPQPSARPPHAPAAYTHFFLPPAPLPPQQQQQPPQLSPVPSSSGWKSLRIASPAVPTPPPPPPPPAPQLAAQRTDSEARQTQRRRW